MEKVKKVKSKINTKKPRTEFGKRYAGENLSDIYHYESERDLGDFLRSMAMVIPDTIYIERKLNERSNSGSIN